jgi:putative ATP-binding cassette transporter
MRRSMTSFLTGLAEAWKLAKPYFWSEEKWFARGLLLTIILLNLSLVAMNVEFTYFQKYFYNALQARDLGTFIKMLLTYIRVPGFPYIIPGFAGYVVVLTIISVYSVYLNQMLQIRWRRWVTEHFLENWLADRAYYNISLSGANTAGMDNPDQRISEDLRDFTANSLSIGLDFLSNLVNMFSFIFVLYAISGSITIFGIKIPAYMLWLAIIYSIAGTWLTHLIGRKLIALSFFQQKVEADFRYGLIRVRENPEAIALYNGENDELLTLRERFAAIQTNWWSIMRRTKLLNFFTGGFNTIAGNFAIIAASPRYFANLIQIGDLLQISNVFSQVQGGFSWFVSAYTTLVTYRATVSRLHGFQEAVTAARAASLSGPHLNHEGSALSFDHLTLTLPDGRKLVDNASLALPPGQPIILTGPSGAGKSTLFRAIAGIWPFGTGSITRPSGTALFLPQRPYFPLGSLKRVIAYPGLKINISDETVIAALNAVELPNLTTRLAETETWSQILSGGEQQRLALARAIITKPDWLFLDEATSALDAPLAARLHKALAQHLPNTTIVAITHRELDSTSPRRLTLTPTTLANIG